MDIALINYVKKFEALYNPKFVHYHNYRIKMFLWKKIAKTMKRPTHLCIVTWNALVQTFINEHPQSPSKTGIYNSFDYNLFSSLSFLMEIVDFPRNDEDVLIENGIAAINSYDFLGDWRNKGSEIFRKYSSFEAYLGTLRQEENPQEFYFCQHLFKTINVKYANKETFFKDMEVLNAECRIRLDTMLSRNFIQTSDPISTTEVQMPLCDSTTNQCTRAISRKRKIITDLSEELNSLDNNNSEMFGEKVNTWLNGCFSNYHDVNIHNFNKDKLRKSDDSTESVDTVRYVLLNKKPKLANSSRTTIKTFAKANGSSNRLQLSRTKVVKKSTVAPIQKLSANVIPSSAQRGRKKIRKSARLRTESTSLAIYSESEISDDAPKMSFSNYKNMLKSLKRSNEISNNNNNNNNDVNEMDHSRIMYSSQLQENIVLKMSDSNIQLTTQVLHKTLGEEITNRLFKDNPNVKLEYNPKSIVIYRLKENNLDCCNVSSSSESSLLEPLAMKLVYSDTHQSGGGTSAAEDQSSLFDRELISEMEDSLSVFSLANGNSVANADTLSTNLGPIFDQIFRQTDSIESIECESNAGASIDQPLTERTAVWESFNEELENFYQLIMEKMRRMTPIEFKIAQNAILNIFCRML